MTFGERRKAERLAYIFAIDNHTHGINPIAFQSYLAGYEAACESKQAQIEEFNDQIRFANREFEDRACEIAAERARTAKLEDKIDQLLEHIYDRPDTCGYTGPKAKDMFRD